MKPGKKFNQTAGRCTITELFNQGDSNLEYLSASNIHLSAGGNTPQLAFKYEEALIYNLGDLCEVEIEGEAYSLEHYDVLYVPVNAAFRIHNGGNQNAKLLIYRATGDQIYPVYHAKWKKIKRDKKRIRHLHRKEVYLMFDVGEQANKLISGYTFYEDYTRAWPPHNHTDQEEVYSFIEGHGAMEVYESDEKKTFVTSVEVGDHITIPVMNYHPVFSHDTPLAFIWTIAGERYWVGDKNKDFMKGEGTRITT